MIKCQVAIKKLSFIKNLSCKCLKHNIPMWFFFKEKTTFCKTRYKKTTTGVLQQNLQNTEKYIAEYKNLHLYLIFRYSAAENTEYHSQVLHQQFLFFTSWKNCHKNWKIDCVIVFWIGAKL